jgi:hypothetical protein
MPDKYSPVATYYVTTVNSVNLESSASGYVSTQFTALQKKHAAVQDIPTEFEVMQNYPNPFNPTTSISYALPEAASVRLTVSDNLGRDVATLVNEYKEAGYYQANFDASGFSSGIYFYRIEAGKFKAVKKMLLMK